MQGVFTRMGPRKKPLFIGRPGIMIRVNLEHFIVLVHSLAEKPWFTARRFNGGSYFVFGPKPQLRGPIPV
jgi:hypothetical protein